MHKSPGRRPHAGVALAIATLLMVLWSMAPAMALARAPVTPDPKVVIIVGPVGGLTGEYRAAAEAGARAARKRTSNVVTIYSPDATWPAVRNALQGASIVVYLGHGNGWPSRYSNVPRPRTQNGLGLNPVDGSGNEAHQYFGEAYLARDIHLAPHALVLLHHLCYASGNSEPGLPEGNLDTARQRVDNFAAGWLAAGADAVLADAYFGPAWYLGKALDGKGTVESMWRSAPSGHDHEFSYASVRTPGATALMDPDTAAHGFHRSLVVRGKAGLANKRGDGGGRTRTGGNHGPGTGPVPDGSTATGAGSSNRVASLAALGATIGIPSVRAESGVLVAGTQASLQLPVAMPPGDAVPAGSQLGVRWVPIQLDDPPAVPLGGGRGAGGSTAAAGSTVAGRSPGATPSTFDTTFAETPGDLVATVPTTSADGVLTGTMALPDGAGTYQLVTTVHDAGGTAFDASTQALIAPVLLHVSGRVSVALRVIPELTLEAGVRTTISVEVTNDGAEPWTRDEAWNLVRPVPLVTAAWTSLGAGVDTSGNLTAAQVRLEPGESAVVAVPLVVPRVAGSYLVVLDLVSPVYGSLVAMGLPPVMVRATVLPASASATP